MPRIPFDEPDTLPDEYDILETKRRELPDRVTAEWWNNQSTLRAFGHNPELAENHIRTNVSLWTATGLSPADVECVILAVALEADSPYVWHDHAIAAVERAGMAEADVIAIAERELSALPDSTATLVEYVLEYVRNYGDITDEDHEALAGHYEPAQIVGITMLAAYYVFLIHVERALGLGLQEPFLGWTLEDAPWKK